MENKDVQAVLDLLGIDVNDFTEANENQSQASEETPFSTFHQKSKSIKYRKVINRLMNITLQCLGSIRLLVNELEKIRVSLDCTDIDGTFRDSGTSNLIQRQVFVEAVKTMSDTILVARDLDYHDPMKDLIDSFPWEFTLKNKDSHWLILDWSIMSPFLSKLYTIENETSPIIIKFEKEKLLNYSTLIKNVLKYYPLSITEIDKFGQHYLSYLIRIINSSNLSLLEDIFYYHKNCCKLYDGKGKLLIHYSSQYSQSLDIVLLIAEGMKKPLNEIMAVTVDDYGNLPLHTACYGNCSLTIFREILFNYPDACKVKNYSNALPLHLLSQYCNLPSLTVEENLEKFKILISSYPKALELPDQNGLIPLQIGCFYNKTIDYLELLYKHYPGAISKPCNETGRLPLHYNTVYCHSSKIMKYLIDLYPDAVKVLDYNQRLPLHTLIARTEYVTPSRLRCLRLLLEEYPYAVAMKDKDGQTPLDLAYRNGLGDLIIRLLLKADPSQDPTTLGELTYLASYAKYKETHPLRGKQQRRGERKRGGGRGREEETKTSGGRRKKRSPRGADAGRRREGDRGRNRRATSRRSTETSFQTQRSGGGESGMNTYYLEKDGRESYYDSYSEEEDDDGDYYYSEEEGSENRGGGRGGGGREVDQMDSVGESYYEDDYSRRDLSSQVSDDR
jgi:ankyrin repeat protein